MSMKRICLHVAFILMLNPFSGSAWSAEPDWQVDHVLPFSFLFGTHIDSHQQSQLLHNGDIYGFLYITYTGEVTPEGYPVARHCGDDTPANACVIGWFLNGKPGKATFLYHNMDHPVWLVDSRNDIPQPGSHAFFHWITDQSTDPRPVTDARCNAAMPPELEPGAVCPGYFIELRALKRFAFEHGGERILVDPGIDISTHLNIVASTPSDGGHGDD
jgi:hypothetical protein